MHKFIVIILCVLPALVWSQNYPYAIMPGEAKTVTSPTDTLWVMKHSQMQKAIIAAKENKVLREQVSTLNEKSVLTGDGTAVRDSLLTLAQQDVNHYKQQWLECDKDLQTVVKKYKRQRLVKNLALLGTVVGFVAGALIF